MKWLTRVNDHELRQQEFHSGHRAVHGDHFRLAVFLRGPGAEKAKQAAASTAADHTATTAPTPSSRARQCPVSTASPATRPSQSTPRVKIDTPNISGSINLTGAADRRSSSHWIPRNHRSQEPDHRPAVARRNAERIFCRAGLGRGPAPRPKCPIPRRSGGAGRCGSGLGKPVTLTWDNGEGLIFTRRDFD